MVVGTVASVYIEDGNVWKSYRIPEECTVLQTEILAIINDKEFINNFKHVKKFVYFVQSETAFKAISSHRINSKLLVDC